MIAYIEYNDYKREVSQCMRTAEIGPGFIDDLYPDNNLYINTEDDRSVYALRASDFDDRLERFNLFIDIYTEGGVGWSHFISEPYTVDHQVYYNVTFTGRYSSSGDSFKIGPLALPESYFPDTLVSFGNVSGTRTSDLYYLPVEGYPGLLYIVSLDRYTIPSPGWTKQVIYDVTYGLPLIIIFSLAFGILITWLTVRPLRRVTRSTELLSQSNLSERIEIHSNDEIGRLARSFNTMADRLEASFNSQKRFVSDAAHELRTPLAAVKTSLSQMLPAEHSVEDYLKLLTFLSDRVNYMEKLVNELLFLSAMDETKHLPTTETLQLSVLLVEIQESFTYLFEAKNIRFDYDIEPDLRIKGKRSDFLRVISGLLDNAFKHTTTGGTVTLRAFRQSEYVVINVADNGAGIAPEHLPHIFERFYKAPGTSVGFGLGLAIIRSIIQSSGGDISVNSQLGRGTFFEIKLPAV
jgi:signal transduction histidine kinase